MSGCISYVAELHTKAWLFHLSKLSSNVLLIVIRIIVELLPGFTLFLFLHNLDQGKRKHWVALGENEKKKKRRRWPTIDKGAWAERWEVSWLWNGGPSTGHQTMSLPLCCLATLSFPKQYPCTPGALAPWRCKKQPSGAKGWERLPLGLSTRPKWPLRLEGIP